MKQLLKKAAKRVPYLKRVFQEMDRLQAQLQGQFVPPGHYYSPIPSLEEIRHREDRIFDAMPRELPGIDLHEPEQLKLLEAFAAFYHELPFEPQKNGKLRYYYENPNYSYSDAIFLHCMIRHRRPKRIIEVGSGYSSCVILDTNELFFDHSIACTFIEPYPELLLSLIRAEDRQHMELVRSGIQDVPPERFAELAAGDILFIDSTHVSKVGSDVNYIFFEILPRLQSGVAVHFHDVFYPFEYPKKWVYSGISWNEAYLLRAFLQYNEAFRILFFNTYLEHFHRERFLREMPLCMKNPGGSIWIQKA